MADYTAVFLPGLTMTSTALSNITGGDPVEVAGTDLVQKCTPGPSGWGSAKYIGIAATDAYAGQLVTIITDRVVHEGPADGPVNAGDQLMASSAPGCQVTTAPPTGTIPGQLEQADVDCARAVIGVALTTAASGTTVRWIQNR
jgi:Uncharacterized conserved protein (DUF2190)